MLGLVLLGVPALALSAVSDLGPLTAVCLLRGVGFAVVVVAVGALAAAAVPAARRGEGLGLLGVVAMLPAVVALPLGVWLVTAVGFTAVFVVGAAVALVAVPAVAGLPDGTVDAAASRGIAAGLRNPALAGPALLFAATAVASGVVVTFLPAAVVSGDLAAAALFTQSVTATAARWWAGRHADRHGPRRLLVPGAVLAGVGMACAALTGSGGAVLAGMALFGIGFGIVQSASLNLMLARVAAAEFGTVSAAWNLAYDLGWGAGAAGIGMIVAAAGYPAAFAAAAVLVLVAVPLARLGGTRRTTD
jgi:predicted MFS family arabinose efflux permease